MFQSASWTEIDFENRKIGKMANFSVESGSESGSSFIRPLKESECYTNINLNEILLKTHYLVKF